MFNKDNFIHDLIDILNRENEERLEKKISPLDICFIISVIEQRIEEYPDFINDIKNKEYYINQYIPDDSEGYTNGKIEIFIKKKNPDTDLLIDQYTDYHYIIEFLFDERPWGYCQCTPEDEGYNEEHQCCGDGCDWTAPAFNILKVIDYGRTSWDGIEKDYWGYEDKFNLKEENKNKKIEEFKKEKHKTYLKKRILELQKELKKLDK